MKRLSTVLFAVVLAGLPTNVSAAAGEGEGRATQVVDGRYVVVYKQGVDRPATATRGLERAEGFQARLTYAHAVKGFAAALSPGQVRSLRADPRVDFVTPDRVVRAAVPLAAGDFSPSGVRRIEGATSSSARQASSVNVAVIDTGIDLSHPDLNATDGVNCTGTGPAQDDHGHGTHVAGTIGAENDGSGVVGVAPGTKLYAAKVLSADGSGSSSSIICGIDWVTSTRLDQDPYNDIALANMSLGGPGPAVRPCATTTDPEHLAICRSVAAGVTYVVAAGNEAWDFDYAPNPDLPAAYPEVLTVTAMSDGDGSPGALKPPACEAGEADDSYAKFSSFAATSAGAAHTIAGPGTCIDSTLPGGGYGTASGTSMAAPHVAGVVALCIDEAGVSGPCGGMTPAQIVSKLRADAQARPASYGFVGDPGHPVSSRYYGYLAWAGLPPSDPPPPPADTTSPAVISHLPAHGATGIERTTSVSVTFSEEMDAASVEAAFSLTKVGDGTLVPGTFTWSNSSLLFTPNAPLADGAVYRANVAATASDKAGNQLTASRSWDFKTSVSVNATPGSTVIQTGSLRSGTAARLAADDGLYYEVSSKGSTTAWYGRFTGVSNSLRNLRIAYKGKTSRSCTQTLALYRWNSSSWVDVDSRSVGATPVLIEKAVAGTLADYVSGSTGDGELRLRVRCQASGSFVSSGDLMRISYDKP